jgi:hypothetical protein
MVFKRSNWKAVQEMVNSYEGTWGNLWWLVQNVPWGQIVHQIVLWILTVQNKASSAYVLESVGYLVSTSRKVLNIRNLMIWE